MRRQLLAVTAVGLSFLVLVAACGSNGVHTQSYAPSRPSTPAVSSLPSSSSTVTSPLSTTPQSAPPIPTPTVTPPAQDAVNAYMTLDSLANAAARDPATADTSTFANYAIGDGLTVFAGAIAGMKQQGVAYRGTPADPKVKVLVIGSATTIVLSSCPQSAATDPFTEYTVATGVDIPATPASPPTPYQRVITMHLVNGRWLLSNFVVDASKTCTP